MIGLVVTKPAAVTIAGTKPLSMAKVWPIKLYMLVKFNLFQICIVGMLSGIAGGFLVAAITAPVPAIGTIALCTAALLCGLVALGMFLDFSSAQNHAHWMTCDYDEWIYGRRVPIKVRDIVGRLEMPGLKPQIEYLYEDPFLFVEVEGRRVYLAHWW